MKLSIRARLGIIRFINDQRWGLDDSEITADIKTSVEVSQEVLDQCVKQIGNGQQIIDDAALDRVGEVEYEFEKAARRRLLDGLKTYKGYTADDSRWNRQVLAQLDESLADAPVTISRERRG